MISDLESARREPLTRTLLFVGQYVGQGLSGSFRQERMLRYILESGHSVILVSCQGVRVRFFHITSINDLLAIVRRKSVSSRGNGASGRFASWLRALKYSLHLDVFDPGAVLIALSLLWRFRSGRSHLVTVASTPEIKNAIGLTLFALLTPAKVSVNIDFRDAWSRHRLTGGSSLLRSFIEASILKRAVGVTTVSAYLAEEFKEVCSRDIVVVYNATKVHMGHELCGMSIAGKAKNTSRKIIRYFGNIPPDFYRVSDFCDALIRLPCIARQQLRIEFYGQCKEMEDLVCHSDLAPLEICFYPYLTHRDALLLMLDADACLIFGYDANLNGGVVSTKIFEYLDLGVQIVAFDLRRGSDLASIIHLCCGHCDYLNQPGDLANRLMEWVDGAKFPSLANRSSLYSFLAAYSRLVESWVAQYDQHAESTMSTI